MIPRGLRQRLRRLLKPNAPRGAAAGSGYVPASYWKERLGSFGFDMRGVGNKTLTDDENRAAYEAALETYRALCADEGVSFGGAAVLDIGCGTGFYAEEFKRQGAASYLGLDITDVLHGELRRRLEGFRFERRDITQEPAGGTYDVVHMVDVTQHIVDEALFERAMGHLARATKPGGVIVITSWLDPDARSHPHERSRGIESYERCFPGWRFGEPRVFRDKFIFTIRPPEDHDPSRLRVRCNEELVYFRDTFPNENQLTKCLREGVFYEESMLEDIRSRVEPGQTIIDVGGNLGNHTIYFAAVCGCRVVTVEGDPDLFAILCDHIRMNGLDDQITAVHTLVGDRDGTARLFGGDPGNRIFEQADDGDLETRTLDRIWREALDGAPVHLLKIDVESMERFVLRGGLELLQTHRPIIYAELATRDERLFVDGMLYQLGYGRTAQFNATPTYRYEFGAEMPHEIEHHP